MAYSLLAAIFLLVVSLVAGLARFDIGALAKPRAAVICILCVATAVLLRLFIYGQPGTVSAELPALAGLERFPLVVAALAYGPTPGLVIAGLYAAFGSIGTVPAGPEAVLALELALVGWLAIYPSPREHVWAGPMNALVAYALAWATGGLALAQWQVGGLNATNLLELHPGTWTGVLVSSLLLLLVTPAVYRRIFPHSNIGAGVRRADGEVVISPIRRRRQRRMRNLSAPPLPEGLPEGSRRRRGRSRFTLRGTGD